MVEEVGETETEPEGPKVPTPAMETLFALGTFQESVEDCPCAIDEGEAEKDEPEAEGHAPTVTVACNWTEGQPEAPEAVKI